MYLNNMHMTQSSYIGVNQSRQNFLSPPHNNTYTQIHSPSKIADEIFLKSVNSSYIGKMSGYKQPIETLEHDQDILEVIPQYTPRINSFRKKRIDFSRYKISSQQINRSQISEEELKNIRIKQFINENGKDLISSQGCAFFCSQEGRLNCKCELANESTLQIHQFDSKGKKVKLIGSINFDTVSLQITYEHSQQNKQILIAVGKIKLLLEHELKEVFNHWRNKLETMHDQSKGKDIQLTSLLSADQFYKTRYQTEEYFVNNCQTGDVLLFQDDHFFAKAQRFITRSNFDHVGMIIKDPSYGLLIFQANSGSGVSLTPWRYVIRYNWYSSIPKIVWRRLLKIQRNNEFNQKIQKFVTKNLEKDYNISFQKLMAQESVIRPEPHAGNSKEQKAKMQQQNGFFCSELVATVYKQLGLLTRDRNSSNYMPACNFFPKDFSERGQRHLDEGELSPEYQIYFDKKLLKLTYKGMIKD